MAFDAIDIALSLLKIVVVLAALLNVTPIMVWVERRGSALIQDRPGPNRVGPFGLIQSFADALKFILKEDLIPEQAHKWLYTIAPMFGLLPALTTISVIPWGEPFRLPGDIAYGGKLTLALMIVAGVMLMTGLLIAGFAVHPKEGVGRMRLNLTIRWMVALGLILGGFAVGGLVIALRQFGPFNFPGAGRIFAPIVADLNIGILLIFALASLGVYGIVTAGWASSNKYSFFGAIRASAQMISYELALTLAAVSALLAAGSLRLTDVVAQQTGYFYIFNTIKIPAWNCFSPAMWLSFIIFTVSAFAETNRLPFDFAEAEAELVAGYHTEYSSMKFALFFMAEYMSMAAISALVATLYLGGWDIPYFAENGTWWSSVLSMGCFVTKVVALLLVFVWVRWTIPRLKYDILMRLGWKVFLPLALFNIVLVAFFVGKHWI